MSDESLELVERQIGSMRVVGSPVTLRGKVLRGVHRELRASRWDRLVAKAAIVLVVIGVGMNAAIGFRADGQPEHRANGERKTAANTSLVDTAIVVAESTDAATVQRIARQLAAMRGRKLTTDEAAAIDAAVQRPATRSATGNKG